MASTWVGHCADDGLRFLEGNVCGNPTRFHFGFVSNLQERDSVEEASFGTKI